MPAWPAAPHIATRPKGSRTHEPETAHQVAARVARPRRYARRRDRARRRPGAGRPGRRHHPALRQQAHTGRAVDGYGADTWRKITLAELKDEASKCANITEIQYAEAGGDAQTYNAAINGYVAQGFDIILAFTDFGDAGLPAYRSAHMAGATMVPYFNDLSGTPGTDYAVNPYQDSFAVGREFAEWIGATVKEGNVVMLGGTPGSSSSQVFIDGFKDGLAEYPGLTLLDENYIVTNWNPADAQRAGPG